MSLKPAIPGVKPSPRGDRSGRADRRAAASLGHEVRRVTSSPTRSCSTTFTPRWAAGVRDDALAHGDGLEQRTLRMAAVGRRLGGRALRRSIEREPVVAARLNAVFDDHDLVMTPTTAAPPPPAEISRNAGALRTFNQGSPYVCYTPTWNYVGQPAASIPAGFDRDGLPQAIQLAGPPNSETTIVSLAAQIEAAAAVARSAPGLPSPRHPADHHHTEGALNMSQEQNITHRQGDLRRRRARRRRRDPRSRHRRRRLGRRRRRQCGAVARAATRQGRSREASSSDLASSIEITEFTPHSYTAGDDDVHLLVDWTFRSITTGRADIDDHAPLLAAARRQGRVLPRQRRQRPDRAGLRAVSRPAVGSCAPRSDAADARVADKEGSGACARPTPGFGSG